MSYKISVATCAALLMCSGFLSQVFAVQTTKLEGIEVNSVGDNISESGIDEGILNKRVAAGPLADKKVIDMPYQVNTISKEVLVNQGVQGFEDAVRYFPSAQIQYRGGGDVGRPQTRGFQGSVVGNVLWDGFYASSTTAIPMAMFESLQIQNGLAGSLYGGATPSGYFLYSRKRPVPLQNIIWTDYSSRSNLGVGLDTSNKFEKVGYRGVFYYSGGEKNAKDSKFSRRLASLGLDFYLTENLTLETNFSHYEHKNSGMPGGFSMPLTNGVADFDVPSPVKDTKRGLEQSFGGNHLKTTTASVKLKYAPTENWYFEGGYQWQKAIRDMYGTDGKFLNQNGDYEVTKSGGSGPSGRFDVDSWFLKGLTNFETGPLSHNFAVATNGYRWTIYSARNSGGRANLGTSNLYNPRIFNDPHVAKGSGRYKSSSSDMKNISVVDDIKFNDYFSTILSVSRSWFTSYKLDPSKEKNYDKSGFNYGVSLVYKPVENVSLYTTYADSISNEQSTYTFRRGPRAGETLTVEPIRSKQYEIGAKARLGELDLSAAIFEIKRPVAYLVGSGASAEYKIQGTQRNRGFELTTGGKLVDTLSMYGGFTLLDAKIKNAKDGVSEGKTVIGEPKFQTNVLFDYAVPNTNKLAFTTNFHYTGKRYIDNANAHSVNGYFTTDIGARYTTKAWLGKETTIRFDINNLFDKKYWAGMFPSDVDGAIAGRGTSLFLGQSRTFMLSAQVKF
ncbi:TonB-dependent receptor [Campylobacter concisus]|uniref:TonB-dependent receptor n=1 Tax=Campylobacter concisus TaxID=199 RepID=UPI0018AAE649|nr:TonB-dependent receptor [Campylobacter concisus]QPH99470.1 TonB-dependent receptor [Campylobacter concisus]QPI01266.1 TonB-dependent receptor [Campylobacter concisus]